MESRRRKYSHKDWTKEMGQIIGAKRTVMLKEIQLNIPVDDKQFEMMALGLPNDITIFRTDPNDESEAWVYEGDTLVRRSEFLKQQRNHKKDEQKKLQQTLVGKKAPPLKIKDWLQGDSIVLDKLKGRYVLLDFFGEWCSPCHKTYPLLVNTYNSRSPKDLIIIGIHVSGSEATAVKSLLKKYDIKYPIGNDESAGEKDYMGETFAAYYVKSIPHAVLIDRSGDIIAHGRVEEIIKALEENL